jgi:hypothetical protein
MLLLYCSIFECNFNRPAGYHPVKRSGWSRLVKDGSFFVSDFAGLD